MGIIGAIIMSALLAYIFVMDYIHPESNPEEPAPLWQEMTLL
jgi:hypothetical protein